MKRNAQVTLEACVLIIIVVAATLTMQRFFRRAIAGNWKNNADSVSEEQYEESVSNESAPAIVVSNSRLGARIYSTINYPQGSYTTIRSYNNILSMDHRDRDSIRFDDWGTFYEESDD